MKMNGHQEHKRRYNQKLEYITHFEKWLADEPPMILFLRWIKWKHRRTVWKKLEK